MTLEEADHTLRDAMKQALHDYAFDMYSRGVQHDEIAEKLDAYFEVIKQWREEALNKIMRVIDEPKAPSHQLQ